MRPRALARSGRALVACCALGALSGAPSPLGAQETLKPFSPPPGRVVVTERSDFSKYEDGRYLGHLYREARLDLSAAASGGRIAYSGEALVLEETLRDQRAVARRLDGAVPVAFSLEPGGAVRFSVDEGYPILRGLPDPPPRPASPGERWVGEGVVVVKPRTGRPATRIAVLVEYEYLGATRYADRPAATIRARFALRYKGGDPLGDPAMTASSGARTADIVVDAEDGSTLFVRETVDETFSYADGGTVRLKGFILHFHRGSLPSDRERLASLLVPTPVVPPAGIADPSVPSGTASGASGVASTGGLQGGPQGSSGSGSPGLDAPIAPGSPAIGDGGPGGAFELAQGERGLVLLLYDLRFVADGDELLPSERGRLDSIAAALGRIPERTFLVEGHTADLGRPAGQYELSERRAKRIVDELAARGVPAGRFIFRGLGADRPIAPNDTERDRARNRRVEITVLD